MQSFTKASSTRLNSEFKVILQKIAKGTRQEIETSELHRLEPDIWRSLASVAVLDLAGIRSGGSQFLRKNRT